MAVVRLEALRQLAKLIGCAIPEMAGQICVGQADAGKRLSFPTIAIDPRRWKYHPDQALESFEPAPNVVVMNVGRHEADVEIRIGAKTLTKRYELEQKILDLFLETPLHPGVLFAQVTACECLGPFIAAWELEDDEWRDEMAFDQELYSHVAVTGIIPALVTRLDAYTIDQLQLGLELTPTPTDATSLPAFTDPSVGVVQINSDGTISPVP